MAMTRAERSSCGNEHSNHTHPVGPRAPSPCKAYFRRAGAPREFGCLHLEAKASHANQTTGLASSSGSICIPEGRTWLAKAQPEAAVSSEPGRLSLTGMAQLRIYFWKTQFAFKQESALRPQMPRCLPGWDLEIKVPLFTWHRRIP